MSDQKTEQPTKKRLDKAREEGQYPSARQFIGGMQFCALVGFLQSHGREWMEQTVHTTRLLMVRAFGPDLTVPELTRLVHEIVFRSLVPLLSAGAALVGLTLALQLGLTKMGFAVKKLMPDPKRLNPLSRLKQLPGQNLPAALQALILLPVFTAAIYAVTNEHLDTFLRLPLSGVNVGIEQVASALLSLLWKAAGVFFIFGCVDLFREKRKQMNQLRMTKQEIKDEMKESEGNPQIKAKIRALRRDQARKRMMQAVPKATAVIVNPTHYAVALEYSPESMAAPRVVAKGKNHLALRIRRIATENQVPLIENPPLAQALYKSVGLGQEIPPHLYRAVAEILAYVFKLMRRR